MVRLLARSSQLYLLLDCQISCVRDDVHEDLRLANVCVVLDGEVIEAHLRVHTHELDRKVSQVEQ